MRKHITQYGNCLWAWMMLWAEALIWLMALLFLALLPPSETQQTLCVWHHLGVEQCPGCGLGHSIAEFFKGNIYDSFMRHPLGIFALLVIVWRIIQITFHNLRIRRTLNQKYHVEDL